MACILAAQGCWLDSCDYIYNAQTLNMLDNKDLHCRPWILGLYLRQQAMRNLDRKQCTK